MSVSIGKVSRLAGVTVRTLHHYDEIGLLRPSERSAAEYRRYSDADLERLQQILFYRELGLALNEIASVLDDPETDAVAHLRRQHDLLNGRVRRLQTMVAAIEKAIEARQMGINLTPEERLEVFGDFNPDDYAAEVEERWGKSDAYRESRRRTRSYTRDDWKRLGDESKAIEQGLAAAMRDGEPAASPRAMGLAEAHRQQISRWFYECGHEMHRALADGYVNDPRFTAHYEKIATGLAQYVRDAVHANADRAESAG